jgi:hypothetical protein
MSLIRKIAVVAGAFFIVAAIAAIAVAIRDWTFLFGSGLVLGVNTLLAYLMYRSGLVPRLTTMLGLAGSPPTFASATAVMFGLYEQVSVRDRSRPSWCSPGRCRLPPSSPPRGSSPLPSPSETRANSKRPHLYLVHEEARPLPRR